MFGRKNKFVIKSFLHQKTQIMGDVHFEEGMLIDCTVHGCVIGQAKNAQLVIGPNANIHGKIMSASVCIEGKVHGPVECTDAVHIKTKAQVKGNITYQTIKIEEGAIIEGHLIHAASAAAAKAATNADESQVKEGSGELSSTIAVA